MTWQLRSARALGRAHIALALVAAASLSVGAAPALAIELGQLQAIPSNSPPYIFRLPIITPLHGPSAPAAVTVRQPPDVLSFVKQQVVELRLRSLTDIELEISLGGQTLNRLLLKSELQAARRRLDTMPAATPSQPASAKGWDRPLAEAIPLKPAPEAAPNRTLLERELAEIRQEIHSLVGRVTPWEGPPSPIEESGEGTHPAVPTLMLGGLLIASVAALVIGYLLQRKALARERRWRRALTLSIQRMQDQLGAGSPILPAVLPDASSRARQEALQPITVLRRVHVSQQTRRRFRVRASSDTPEAAQDHDAGPSGLPARTPQRMPAAPTELLEALAQLRGELMRLQGRPPTTVAPNHLAARSRQASH
jgi:hypothetical protein